MQSFIKIVVACLLTICPLSYLQAQTPVNCQSITQVLMEYPTLSYYLFNDVPIGGVFVSYEFQARYAVGEPWENCSTNVEDFFHTSIYTPSKGGPTCNRIIFQGGFVHDKSDETRHYFIQLNAATPGLWGAPYVRMIVNYTMAGATVCSSQMSYTVTRGTAFQQKTDLAVPTGKTMLQVHTAARDNLSGPWKNCGSSALPASGVTAFYNGCKPDPNVGMQLIVSHPPFDDETGVNTSCGANAFPNSDGQGWCRIRVDYQP